MRTTTTLLLFLAAVTLFAATSPFPATPAGGVAKAWVEAFPTEPGMKAFLLKNISEDGLKRRSLDDRLKTYRDLKKKYVTLRFDSIVESSPYELHVSMLCTGDNVKRTFIFAVDPEPPNKLASISIAELQHHGLGALFH
jgi:hypothetical protein